MTLQCGLKNVSLCIREDTLLLETCLSEMFYLVKTSNSYCQTLFWEKVTHKISLQTNCIENIGEIKQRFDIIYDFYLQIRTTPFFVSKMYKSLDDEQRAFFSKMDQCFSKVYYNQKGVLTLAKTHISKVIIDDEFTTNVHFNDLISYDNVQSTYTNDIFLKQYVGPKKTIKPKVAAFLKGTLLDRHL